MTDMTVALRVFADTASAQTGLKQVAEAFRAMGAGAKAVAVDSVEAAMRSATSWRASGTEVAASMTAVGAALEAGVPDLSGALRAQSAELTQTAMASAEAAAAVAELRAMLHPLAGAAQAAKDGLEQVALAEEMGALNAREAAVLTDRLNRSLMETERAATAAGLPLRNLGQDGAQTATAMQRMIDAQTGVTRAAEGSIAAQLQHGEMLDDLRARFSPLFAAQRQYELLAREIAEAERLGAISAGEAADARARASAAMSQASAGIVRVGQSSGAAAAYTANLGYQLNDIAMMMSAGQNPFMLMMQQGPQVVQVFEGLRSAGLGIGASLRSALVSMVSPMSLITLGVIGGGAALVQWLSAAGDEADKTGGKVLTFAEKVDEATAAIRSSGEAARRAGASGLEQLRQDYGIVTEAVVELARELAAIERRAATVKINLVLDEALGSGFASQIDRVIGTVGAALTGSFTDQIPAMQAEIAALEADIANRKGMGVFVSESEVTQLSQMREELAAMRGDMAGIGALASEITVDPALVSTLAAARAQLEQARKASDFGAVADGLREVHRLLVASGQTVNQEILDGLVQAEELARKIAGTRSQASGEKLLAELTQEAELQRLIAAHGENSAEVTRARAAAEREALVQRIEAAGWADDLAAAILAAFDNAEALAGVNMAPGIAAARAEAVGLAAQLGVALDTAVQIRALNALETAKVEFSPGGRALSAYGSRAPGGTAPQQALATRNAPKKAPRAAGGVGGGGGLDRESVAGLAAEGVALMRELEIAQSAIAEKVRAGLMTAAEGSEALADAKVRAANQLADLIAKLDMLGPAGKAAAETARQALQGLGIEAESVGAKLRASIVDSFEDNFARSLATGKNAMSAFADHVKMELARAFTQKFVTPLVSPLINGLMGLFGGLFPSAQGNVFQAGRAVPFAKGGVPDLAAHRDTVVHQPTVFPMAGGQAGVMGEAGPEAILPLLAGMAGLGVRALRPDGTADILPLRRAPGGALGVALPEAPDVGAVLRLPTFFASGGVVGRLSEAPRMGEAVGGIGASRPPAQIIINNNHPTAKVEATERQGSDGMSMDIVIEQIEGTLADRARRGVGSLSGVLGAEFGLSRQGR